MYIYELVCVVLKIEFNNHTLILYFYGRVDFEQSLMHTYCLCGVVQSLRKCTETDQ